MAADDSAEVEKRMRKLLQMRSDHAALLEAKMGQYNEECAERDKLAVEVTDLENRVTRLSNEAERLREIHEELAARPTLATLKRLGLLKIDVSEDPAPSPDTESKASRKKCGEPTGDDVGKGTESSGVFADVVSRQGCDEAQMAYFADDSMAGLAFMGLLDFNEKKSKKRKL